MPPRNLLFFLPASRDGSSLFSVRQDKERVLLPSCLSQLGVSFSLSPLLPAIVVTDS